ncbi:MAG TPA: hypothetical protein VGR28_09470, partial [Candidatus Thermoplasmatota archaeon]|nr:hypothetical protein [Candidatus Thermoplasmatota archaeon]
MRAVSRLALLAALLAAAAPALGGDQHHASASLTDPDTGHPLSVLGPGSDPLLETAVGVGAVAGIAGALAWFWPRIQFFAAPLFTRIPRDEALNQVNREKVYNLIRERPGIHAHAIATHLRLGWSTAFYHLRTLETHGLVASRRV